MNELTVIKAGTGVLTRVEDGTLDGAALVRLVTAIAGVFEDGRRCVLVSSGAVGAGVSAFGLEAYPDEIVTRQACAAVGQARLMHTYENLFRNFGISVAQVLLAGEDLRTTERATCVRNTLTRLLQTDHILPILNENDSVAVEELRVGDNDMLSARVARLLGARRLILLSTVDGLLDPETDEVIREVTDLGAVEGFARQEQGRFSIGGMASKLKAIRLAAEGGIETHIAHGRHPERLAAILRGEACISTRFSISPGSGPMLEIHGK